MRKTTAWGLPYVVIANVDGSQKVQLLEGAATQCSSILVGDYLEAEGEKQHEQLFYAFEVSIHHTR